MENAAIEASGGLDSIQSELKQEEDYLLGSKDRQRKLRLWGHGVTLAILVVFAIYIIALYTMLRDNLSSEKFTRSLNTHIAQIAPVVTDSSVEVMKQVSPVYMDLAHKKAKALMPELTKSLEKQANRFAVNTLDFAKGEYNVLFEKIISQQVKEFQKAYPDLTAEQMENFMAETKNELRTVFIQLSRYVAKHPIPDTLEKELIIETLSKGHTQQKNIDLYNLFLRKLMLLLAK